MNSRANVLLVGNYAGDGQYSMLAFGRALMRGLPGHQLNPTFIAPTRRLWRPSGGMDKWAAYVDKYVSFPRQLRKAAQKADIIHVLDQGNGIYLSHIQTSLTVVTCHDLLAIRAALGELPYWQTGRKGRVYQAAILRGLKTASYVACSSGATLKDARRLLGIPDARLRQVKQGSFDSWTERRGDPAPESVKVAGLSKCSSYVLQVGGSKNYKNCGAAVSVFAALQRSSCTGPANLVIVGKDVSANVQRQIAEFGIGDKVLHLKGLSGPDLEWLYSNAWGLLMTSFDEGFGLPIIEAQNCGCPVFATDKEPMTEIGGAGAVYIDPSNPVGAAQKIIESYASFAELRQRGYDNAKNYTTEGMVADYAGIYRDLRNGLGQ